MSEKMKNSPKLRFPEFVNDVEWEEKELRNLITYFKGFAFQSKDYTSNGRRIVRVSDMGFDYIKDETNAIYIDEQKANEFEKWKLQKNDLVITTVGSKPPVYDSLVGRTIIVQTKDKYSLLNQNAVCLRAKKIEQGFLNVLFKRSEYVSFIESIIRGNANQGSIALEDLFKYMCFIPSSTEEQQKIADCLNSVDSLISAQSQKVELLKEHKKGLMQQLFPQDGEEVPKFRFPEFINDGEWETKPINQVCKINPSTKDLPSKFVYIDLESVDSGVLLQKKIIDLDNAPSRAQRLLQQEDIIFQMVRPYQKNNYFFDIKDRYDYVASTGYAQLRAYQSKKYLFQFLHSDNFVNNVLNKCTGSNYPAINSTDLSEIIINIPKPEEQQKIADCLSSIDEQISSQTRKLKTLKEHKKGLMQQLFPSAKES